MALSAYNRHVKSFARSHRGMKGTALIRAAARSWRGGGKRKRRRNPRRGRYSCSTKKCKSARRARRLLHGRRKHGTGISARHLRGRQTKARSSAYEAALALNMPGKWWSGDVYRPPQHHRGPRGGKDYRPVLHRRYGAEAWLPTSFYTSPRPRKRLGR